jgi:hypothetical protein
MEEKYTFLFTENEANTILGALGELPAKTSMAIIANIQKQYKEQTEKPEEEVKVK